jgi:5-methylcytosine-specific restriction endonuclease McrA
MANDWSWNHKEAGEPPPKASKPKVTFSKSERKKKKKRARSNLKHSGDCFYKSKEWRKLRYQVLRKYSAECMCCGRSKKNNNVVIHVDHIKPRSKYPHLSLEFSNLQVLCEDCNLGKSNIDAADWRPVFDESDKISAALDAGLIESLPSKF